MQQWIKSDNWHKAKPLELHAFDGENNPLRKFTPTLQVQYLLRYLSGLKCKTVICEPHYFDRDYLSEFSEFYSTSARGYPNSCSRLHFFSESISKEEFVLALGDDSQQTDRLKKSYLGFTVIRPIPCAPLGRTVLTWYTDRSDVPQRTKTLRKYVVHLAGVPLTVYGLAWQQQDTGVGACATIALWSALHSSAFDDHHSIPTTAEVTKIAHKTASLGDRVFPSGGLTASQLLEAIKELNLQPAMEEGELKDRRFSKERFGALCVTFLRSGYPVIVMGRIKGTIDLHAVCVVGFRESPISEVTPGTVESQGKNTSVLYVHDDNLGPQVRFEIETFPEDGSAPYVAIRPNSPAKSLYWGHDPDSDDPTSEYWSLIPEAIAVPMHRNVRTSPSAIGNHAQALGKFICGLYNAFSTDPIGVSVGSTFFLQKNYLGRVLSQTLKEEPPALLGKVRMELIEELTPMSLFVGVVRVWHKGRPLFDVLFDTTDSDRNMPVFGTVIYDATIAKLLDPAIVTQTLYRNTGLKSLGTRVHAFVPNSADSSAPTVTN